MAETIKKINAGKVASEEPASLPIRIKIAGNAMIITSSLKLDSIKHIEKYDPRALAMHTYSRDEEIEIFKNKNVNMLTPQIHIIFLLTHQEKADSLNNLLYKTKVHYIVWNLYHLL